MKKTTRNSVVNTEAAFDISELFFSITDSDSRIVSGNDVFVRISGYTKEELLGEFHNIIRHPDMPKIVFKTLWDYIQNGRPIVAYVKNRSKSGQYYWVLAAVFPLKQRYVSIRLKPSSEIFAVLKELYGTLLKVENEKGVEESGEVLLKELNALGYGNYDEFMSDALLKELQGRKELLGASSQESLKVHSALMSHLKSAHGHTQTLMDTYEGWFDQITMFIHTKSMFEEKCLLLREAAREIVFLSLNASVSSYKIENGGETFGILARDIRNNAKENDSLIGHIDRVAKELSSSLSEIIFSVCGIGLQTQMLRNFIQERLCEEQIGEDGESMDILVTLVAEYSEKSNRLQSRIDRQLQESLSCLDQLEKQMLYLGYIQVYGLIEAAGNSHGKASFEGIFSQLKTLIETTSKEIGSMWKTAEHSHYENRQMMNASAGIGNVVARLQTAIADIAS